MKLLETRLAHRARRSRVLRPLGIAAYRTVDRLTPAPPGPRVVANSMPKSGTHLLTELLEQIDGMRFSGQLAMYTPAIETGDRHRMRHLERRTRRLRTSHYLMGHIANDEHAEAALASHDVKLVTILRDPRAVVLSGMNYLYNATWMPHRQELLALLPDERAVLEFLVRGHGEPGEEFYTPEIGHHYNAYASWVGSGIGTTVRFEDLVGARGGGLHAVQLETVQRILTYLGYPADEDAAAGIARGAFSSDSITFHGGRVDAWRDRLPRDLADEIAERCGADMTRLGYA